MLEQTKKDYEIIQFTPEILANTKVHTFSSSKQSADFIWKIKDYFIWNIMSYFEGISVSIADTEAILNGCNIDNVRIHDMLKIIAYDQALKNICHDIQKNYFFQIVIH